jgi:hypothetical protein
MTGCICITAKSKASMQEVQFYVSDANAFEDKLRQYAADNHIRVTA